MTPSEQNHEIAKICGTINSVWSWKGNPNYINDLNAMHSAEKELLFSGRRTYLIELRNVVSAPLKHGELVTWENLAFATAVQRSEAFLRSKGLWTKE